MKETKAIPKYALIVLTLALTACGKMEFNQAPLIEPIKRLLPFKPSTEGVEIVSGSTMQKRTVLNGYYVDASVGAPRDQLDSRTPNGYQVFHGVKGAIVSESASQ